jgi:drug/metabolite transporter (DMT)-like permease
MIHLAGSIIASTLILVIFKIFEKRKVDIFPAIVINYSVAASFGLIYENRPNFILYIYQTDWKYWVILIGILFISIFRLMAISTQKSGVSVTSVANKMSMIFPVIFALLFFNETGSLLKIIGIATAIIGVVLTNLKSNISLQSESRYYPLLLFIAAGFLDTILNYVQKIHVQTSDIGLFVPSIFGVAFLLGLSYLAITKTQFNQLFHLKNIIGGLILGLVNFFSIYFFLQVLKDSRWESSLIFPLNNVGIVLLGTTISIAIFKEKLNSQNKIGILLACISILLLAI